MAQDDLLSQEEIDALLGGSGDEEKTDPGKKTGMQPYDPAKQHRIIRERLYGLDLINQRFARNFRAGLFNLIRRSADITLDNLQYQSYEEFVRNVPVPTNLNLVSMAPLRGTALVVFPPNLIYMVVDNLFGGDGRFLTKSEGREFTNTEQRIIRRVLDLTLNAYQDSWQTVYDISASYLRSEIQAKFANITNSPKEIIVKTTFHIDVGNLSSYFQICLPYSMVEPIRDLLIHPTYGSRHDGDPAWSRRMAGKIRDSSVELTAEFVSIASRLKQVHSLRPGDVLPIDLPETVITRVDGVPVLECDFGTHKGQRALRVRRVINHANQGPNDAEGFVKEAPHTLEDSNHG